MPWQHQLADTGEREDITRGKVRAALHPDDAAQDARLVAGRRRYQARAAHDLAPHRVEVQCAVAGPALGAVRRPARARWDEQLRLHPPWSSPLRPPARDHARAVGQRPRRGDDIVELEELVFGDGDVPDERSGVLSAYGARRGPFPRPPVGWSVDPGAVAAWAFAVPARAAQAPWPARRVTQSGRSDSPSRRQSQGSGPEPVMVSRRHPASALHARPLRQLDEPAALESAEPDISSRSEPLPSPGDQNDRAITPRRRPLIFPAVDLHGLTPKKLEILGLLGRGMARTAGPRPPTGAHTRTAAAALALRLGLYVPRLFWAGLPGVAGAGRGTGGRAASSAARFPVPSCHRR